MPLTPWTRISPFTLVIRTSPDTVRRSTAASAGTFTLNSTSIPRASLRMPCSTRTSTRLAVAYVSMLASARRAFDCSALGPQACFSASTSIVAAVPGRTSMLPEMFESINVAALLTGNERVNGSVDSTQPSGIRRRSGCTRLLPRVSRRHWWHRRHRELPAELGHLSLDLEFRVLLDLYLKIPALELLLEGFGVFLQVLDLLFEIEIEIEIDVHVHVDVEVIVEVADGRRGRSGLGRSRGGSDDRCGRCGCDRCNRCGRCLSLHHGASQQQRSDGVDHVCDSSQDRAFISETVSCSSATFMRSASSRLVCATNERGSALSAARLSSMARSIDFRLCGDFRGDGRVERAVLLHRQLFERRDGVQVVLFGELQLRRGVRTSSATDSLPPTGRPGSKVRTTRRRRASPRAQRQPPTASMRVPSSRRLPTMPRAPRGESIFAAIAFHTAGEGVCRSSVAAAARISIKSFSSSRQSAHPRQWASSSACLAASSVPSTASPSHSLYRSQVIQLPSEAPAAGGGLCEPVISTCPR